MEYFEVTLLEGDGLCSDNQCPCADTIIPRGGGYLYISQDCVEFRRDACSVKELHCKGEKMAKQLNAALGQDRLHIFSQEITTAILMCEQAARLRNLDLAIAASDAAYCWKTGLAPLRATPIKQTSEQKALRWWQFWK